MESLYRLLQKQEPVKQKKVKAATKNLIKSATLKQREKQDGDVSVEGKVDSSSKTTDSSDIKKKVNITASEEDFDIGKYMADLRKKNIRVFKKKKGPSSQDKTVDLQQKVKELETIIRKKEKRDEEAADVEEDGGGESKTTRKPKTIRKKQTEKMPTYDPEVLIETDTSRLQLVEIDGEPILSRFPDKISHINLKSSQYHLNNRETFLNFINTVFAPYRIESQKDDDSISCKTINDRKKIGRASCRERV